MNKKSRIAAYSFVIAQLLAIAGFILLLTGLMEIAILLAGLAFVFYVLAIYFGWKAQKEIAREAPPEKEEGSGEAKKAVAYSAGILLLAASLAVLALLNKLINGN
ncbi:MAG: hypothetical protein HY064_01135 [Bacteroidetes bacterium]|nr:hypothetical protein [Bacteroidota bacterium]